MGNMKYDITEDRSNLKTKCCTVAFHSDLNLLDYLSV